MLGREHLLDSSTNSLLRVAICDDDRSFIEKYRSVIHNVLQNDVGAHYHLTEYESSEALLQDYLNGKRYDILLLDLSFGLEMDGHSLAKRIRAIDMKVKLIFVTADMYAAEGIIVHEPAGYIKKMTNIIHETEVQLARVARKVNHDFIFLKTVQGERTIIEEKFFTCDIPYIQRQGKWVIIHVFDTETTPTYEYRVRTSIKELNVMLTPNDNFVQINSATIVNYTYVENLIGRQITLKTGKSFDVSRNFIHDVYKTKVKFFT